MMRGQHSTSKTHAWEQRMYPALCDTERNPLEEARIGDEGGGKPGKTILQQLVIH